jgi:hypothetical protein
MKGVQLVSQHERQFSSVLLLGTVVIKHRTCLVFEVEGLSSIALEIMFGSMLYQD